MKASDFFESLDESKKKVKEIVSIKKSTLAEWEGQKANLEHSPGAVIDSEEVYRAILDPIHFDDKDQSVKPTAFDDILTHGLSMHRKDHTTEDAVRVFQEGRVTLFNTNEDNINKPRRSYLGCVLFLVRDLRSLLNSHIDESRTGNVDERMVFVFDTANAQDKSHAEACGFYTLEAEKRRIRSEVYKMAKNRNTFVCC